MFDWILKDGKTVYMNFLLTHPSYVAMINEPPEKMDYFFSNNIYFYTGKPIGIFRNVETIFPIFSYVTLFLSVIILLSMILKRCGDIRYLFFVALYMALIANAIMIYNADSLETDRHLFQNSVFVEIFGAIFLCLIIDSISLKSISHMVKSIKAQRHLA